MSRTTPVDQDLVLLGGGHSHLAVLRDFALRPLAGLRITLVSDVAHAAYSGMLPGLVAGTYRFDETHFDLVRLCRAAGARFVQARADGLDARARRVSLVDRPALRFDLLSINVGATPALARVPGAAGRVLPVKPVGGFLDRWQETEQALAARGGPVSIGVVGAGAGGVEIALALGRRLGPRPEVTLHLFEAGPEILPGFAPGVRRRLRDRLAAGGILMHCGSPVAEIDNDGLRLEDGDLFALDRIVWTTGAAAPDWLAASDLTLDERGFIAVEPTLRALDQTAVFAAGDAASLVSAPRPKSGVFAVRQGPVLAANLRRCLLGRPLRPYRPQRRFLSLLSTADGRAVAARGGVSFEGPLAWRWKDRIDRRFMARYAGLPVMAGKRPAAALPGAPALLRAAKMRCKGCGAKLAGDELDRVLTRLHHRHPATIADPPGTRDDAAVAAPPPGQELVQSVDLLPALLSDPFVFGQIAATHCLGDLYAMGAQPWTALALAGLPFAATDKREEELFQLLAGAAAALEAADVGLVGGHSGESADLQLGFAVTGLAAPGQALRKSGLAPGQALILTKPLGSGVLFAGEMRGRARGRWLEAAIAAMLRSNRSAADSLRAQGATSMTDVTGFGLAGHLLEMLEASNLDAVLEAAALPALDGARELLADGLESSIAPANRDRLLRHLDPAERPDPVAIALLCDPQTSGGLLAGVPAARAEDCLRALHDGGDRAAAVVGRVTPRAGATARISF